MALIIKHLFIFSAPSGCGKTSLAQALIAKRKDVIMAVSHTTRAIRPGEQDGDDYFFISNTAFERMINQHAFLEHARVFGYLYGTSVTTAQTMLDQGRHVILDIDWQGARQVRKIMQNVKSVFILPPSIETLEQRLRSRGQDDEQTIKRRMDGAKNEMLHKDEYDHQIINDDFNQALAELDALFDSP